VGIELFLKPDEEVLVARDGQDVAELIGALDATRAREIGRRALQRVLAEHTYAHRAKEADRIFRGYRREAVEAAE
jgi:spore maturation protein CgeB